LTSQEAAGFLRKIADQIEGKSIDDPDLRKNFKKISLSLKRESGQISLKIEVKHDEPGSDIGEGSGHAKVKKYRAAKKRMKHNFRDICLAVSEGKIPSENLTESFFRDSDIMISYPRYGEEYYTEYIQAFEEFRSALNKKDLESAALLCEKIKKIKSVCHKQYK
jgi:XXXCH domain-containing protein